MANILRLFICVLFAGLFFTGSAANAQTTTTYSNATTGTVNAGITGGTQCLSRTIAVSTNIIISDIDIGLLASMTNRSTVSASLTSPTGTTVQLFNQDTTNNQNINTRFDTAAAAAFTASAVNHNTATAPYQFTLRPTGNLSNFNGQNANGNWTFQICNGGFLAPTVTFTRADLFVTSIAQPVSDLSLTKIVSSNTPPSATANSYTLTLSSAAGWDTASGVTVRDILPAGATFVSATPSNGSYNSGTGIWTVTSIAPGTNRTLTINFTVNASQGAVVTNEAEVLTSPNFDFDSTPGDGAGDDYDTVNFTVSGTRVAGTPPTLVCPAGTRLFDWDTVAWTAGSLSNSYAVTGIGNIGFTLATTGAWVNDATYGGLSPTRTTAINGGFTGQTSLVQYIDFANRSQVSTATITLPTAVPGAQFRLLDVDFAANDFADRVVVTGTFNGSPVTPTLTNGTANYVISNTAIGDQGADNATAQGTVVVTFASPVDTIVITYGNHTTAPTNPDGQAMGLHDITFCNPQATLSVTKISNVVSDPFSPSNPKAIPGAVIRYCILVTNPGSATAANIASTDTLTANLTFVPGSMLSGTSCVGATTAEDDNNTGGDESDPFGMSRAGNVITGVTATLAPSASFAMVFNATVN